MSTLKVSIIEGLSVSAPVEFTATPEFPTPSDGDSSQKAATTAFVAQALLGAGVPYYPTGSPLPLVDNGPIFHADFNQLMTWQVFNLNGANYTGYASIDVGRLIPDSQPTPRVGRVASGLAANLDLLLYAQLWNWALHNGLVVPIGSWTAGMWAFADNGDGTFRTPDVRAESIRMFDDGRGIDVARAFTDWQDGQMPSHTHTYKWYPGDGAGEVDNNWQAGHTEVTGTTGATGGTSNSGENRMRNFVQLASIQI